MAKRRSKLRIYRSIAKKQTHANTNNKIRTLVKENSKIFFIYWRANEILYENKITSLESLLIDGIGVVGEIFQLLGVSATLALPAANSSAKSSPEMFNAYRPHMS